MADREVHGVRVARRLKQEYHVDLTLEIKRENTARLYGIDISAQTAKLSKDAIGIERAARASA